MKTEKMVVKIPEGIYCKSCQFLDFDYCSLFDKRVDENRRKSNECILKTEIEIIYE